MTVTVKNIGGMDVGYFDCDNCDNSVQEDAPEAEGMGIAHNTRCLALVSRLQA